MWLCSGKGVGHPREASCYRRVAERSGSAVEVMIAVSVHAAADAAADATTTNQLSSFMTSYC